ncbi:hypothetical protein [Kordia sp.]|uniref:hypothetical protein n=1 Tax=Kordia sp. TaxID=1965332 RepID=UPI003D6C1314
MANQENITKGMSQTQNAIEFINKSVLKPDVTPMKGTAAPMIDQATGMMVQDLQSFLKGFEQVGLIALARLANNILTYGTYFGPKPSDGTNMEVGKDAITTNLHLTPDPNAEKLGSDAMKGLFSMVGEYGKMKAEISSAVKSLSNEISKVEKDISDIAAVVEDVSTVKNDIDNSEKKDSNDKPNWFS